MHTHTPRPALRPKTKLTFHLQMLKALVFLAFGLLGCACLAQGQEPARQFALSRPYLGAAMEIPFWHFGGHAVVSDEYIRLTPDRQSKRGFIWSKQATSFQNWDVVVEFKVHGQGKKLFGDGFAFWYTKNSRNTGLVFGNEDFFTGLAVFFDTYSNHNGHHHHGHPYVSAMVNDGTKHYDHDADGTHTELAGCEAKFRNKDYPTRARITYINNVLQVFLDIDNSHYWQECFTHTGVHLPSGYYFGISAATGDVADNHDIINVQVTPLEIHKRAEEPQEAKAEPEHKPFADHETPQRKRVEDNGGSLGDSIASIFYIVFGVLAVLILVGAAVIFIRMKMEEQKSKRLY